MYKEITDFIKYLKIYRDYLTNQQYKTLKGKAMSNDMISARKGLTTILKRQGLNVSLGRW